MKKYATVIGEITAETFQRYATEVHVGPRVIGTEALTPWIWNYENSTWAPNSYWVDNIVAGVLISSPGGDIGYMLAMLDDIDYWKRPTLATGICQSAAAVLATCGEGRRTCTMDALFRFMPADVEIMDDPENPGEKIERVSDLRAYLQSMLVARIAQRLKIERIEADLMFDGKFITSIRAKELGLIDEVISTEDTPYGKADCVSGSERQTAQAREFIDIGGYLPII